MGRCKHIRRPCIVQLCRCTAVRIQKLHTRFHCHLLFSALKGKRSTGAAGHIQMLNRNFLMLAAHPWTGWSVVLVPADWTLEIWSGRYGIQYRSPRFRIGFCARSSHRFLKHLVKFRNWGAEVALDFYSAISAKTTGSLCCT